MGDFSNSTAWFRRGRPVLRQAVILVGGLGTRLGERTRTTPKPYGIYIMYIGGMLNFATRETYWVKIAALAVALLIEARLARTGVALVPWIVFRVPQHGCFKRLRVARSRIDS
jgi:hypothetical protein